MPSDVNPVRIPYQPLRGFDSPVVSITLFHDRASVIEKAYVDSGALYSIFAANVANELGLNLLAGKRATVMGLDGRRTFIYLHPVGLRIGTMQIRAEVGFAEQFGLGFNLLGRRSVFNQLQFCFNDRDGALTVSRLES
ncbi:MAG: hypothetical protein HY868_09950 [Chloroflexi bacterium]|nr:hypothetical protein [Chloroflexota bacterium]